MKPTQVNLVIDRISKRIRCLFGQKHSNLAHIGQCIGELDRIRKELEIYQNRMHAIAPYLQ
jgi:hypothetical protein